ncbi:membrane hypothetical protein [Candidatus Sulfotelmatomonas gaucii]|uniref:Uncharacterized protein n=1 Tax=Candidatus Sulfuritelmatomonas gaucii TaxID=2043161 RepID=A0A2N9M2N2_9BACT|nr:membrane hypothetical protein [Candidatus Sulfotelmatomonas gaucii]
MKNNHLTPKRGSVLICLFGLVLCLMVSPCSSLAIGITPPFSVPRKIAFLLAGFLLVEIGGFMAYFGWGLADSYLLRGVLVICLGIVVVIVGFWVVIHLYSWEYVNVSQKPLDVAWGPVGGLRVWGKSGINCGNCVATSLATSCTTYLNGLSSLERRS